MPMTDFFAGPRTNSACSSRAAPSSASKRSSSGSGLPHGFASGEAFEQVGTRLNAGLAEAGYTDARALLQGRKSSCCISASPDYCNSMNGCPTVKAYLLFGIASGDLHDARCALECALGIKMHLHESGYRCGEYYRLGDVGGAHFILQKNFDGVEGEWMEPAFREFGLLFYANEIDRPEFIRSAIAALTTLLSSQEV
jgi:hypothetical protein